MDKLRFVPRDVMLGRIVNERRAGAKMHHSVWKQNDRLFNRPPSRLDPTFSNAKELKERSRQISAIRGADMTGRCYASIHLQEPRPVFRIKGEIKADKSAQAKTSHQSFGG